MDFFEHQEQARQRTWILLVLLVLAVALLITVTAVMAHLFWWLYTAGQANGAGFSQNFTGFLVSLVQSKTTYIVTLGVSGVVGLGALWKAWRLAKGGGSSVAISLGGVVVAEHNHKDYRTLMNVVEEMALAAALPVPMVYVTPTSGINAFAAGFGLRDAVIGVTQGAVDQLNREQLQGVIAHEFSHILNGDMRLNMRILALLHGILLIGLIGKYLAKSKNDNPHRRHNRGNIFGLAMMAVGYGGTFCGRIISAAVSREREYLADAHSVQFTRNPIGLGSALEKIAGFGAKASNRSDESEYSHFYFASVVRATRIHWLATHPSITERLQRIGYQSQRAPSQAQTNRPEKRSVPATAMGLVSGRNVNDFSSLSALQSTPMINTFIPTSDACEGEQIYRKPLNACGAVFALLYGEVSDVSVRRHIQEEIKQRAHPHSAKIFDTVYGRIENSTLSEKLILLNQLLPILKRLSQTQYQQFKRVMSGIIKADRQLTFFEWNLYRIITRTIENPRHRINQSLTKCEPQVHQLFQYIAQQDNEITLTDVNYQLKKLALAAIQTTQQVSLVQLNQAMNQLEKLKPLAQPRLLKAVVYLYKKDGHLSDRERVILTMLAQSLDCPLPSV